MHVRDRLPWNVRSERRLAASEGALQVSHMLLTHPSAFMPTGMLLCACLLQLPCCSFDTVSDCSRRSAAG